MSGPALALRDIEVVYRRGAWPGAVSVVKALDGVSVEVGAGECVGVVGESGSGKSTLAQVAVGLLKPTSGVVAIDGDPVPPEPRARSRDLRRRLQFVPQDPYGSLNPVFSVRTAVAEGLAIHGIGDRASRAAAALAEVGLDASFLERRPHQLSGGQRQRVAIARALAVDPQTVVLDEPTSALDLAVQAQILNLLLELQERRGLGYLLISHDIDVVRHLAHRVYVLRAGVVVEAGATTEVLSRPRDPYTRALIDAAPTIRTSS